MRHWIYCFTIAVIYYALPTSLGQSVDFKAWNQAGIILYANNSFQKLQTPIRFVCNLDSPASNENVYFALFSAFVDNEWKTQVDCTLLGEGKKNATLKSSVAISFESEPTCEIKESGNSRSTELIAVAKLPEDISSFRCGLQVGSAGLAGHSDIILQSYIIPSTPVYEVSSPGHAAEGTAVNFSCSVEAKPPAKLRFYVDGDLLDVRKYTQLPANDISNDDPFGMSNITWSVNVTKAVQKVQCRVVEHPSNQNPTANIEFTVYYGPDTVNPADFEYNLELYPVLPPLVCNLDAYPLDEIEYTWYTVLVDPNNIITGATNRNFTIPPEAYSNVNASKELQLVYWCEGVNNRNNGKKETKKFQVTITTPPKRDGSGDKVQREDLLDWHIALIAIACILAVIALLVVMVICICRSRTRTPPKKKAVAANDRNSDNSRYQSSTGSLSRADTKTPYGGYHENPTLPVGYRQNNVEQYADAIDEAPRSRKPIALDDMDTYENAPLPMHGEAPPAYHSTGTMNSGYSNQQPMPSQPDYYNHQNAPYSPSYASSYGAAC